MKIFELSGDVHFLPIAYDKEVTKLVEQERGKRIGALWGSVSLKTRTGAVKKGTPLGDCPYFIPPALIVSEKLKGLIQSFTDDEIEFLPVKIDGQPGYSYMNVLCTIDALDLEKTELRRFEDGAIKYVIQAHYRDEVIDGHHMFRLPNYRGVYITEGLRKYLEDNGILGAAYRDTGERVENPFAEVFNKPKKEKQKRSKNQGVTVPSNRPTHDS